MNRWEQYNFTDDFQDAILACLIRYPKDFYSFGEIIKPEYFNGPAASELVFRILEYKKKFGGYPEFTTLGNFAFHKAANVNIDHAKETLEYVEKLAKISTKDKDAILDMAVTFAKERAIYDAVRKIHATQMEGKPQDVIKIMEDARRVGEDQSKMGVSVCHQSDEILDRISAKGYGVKTGFDHFDQLWKTGWAPGWLIVPLAPPKRYKTAFCINLAISIVKTQDVDVLYYACEISEELAGFRAISNVTDWTQEQLLANVERGKIIAKKKLKSLIGNIWIKGFPSKGVTISEIKSHAKQVIDSTGLMPKAIVIDYAETVRPDSVDKKAPDWRQQADIYTQARALGHDLGCCVIMPDRCNADTVGKVVPSMKSFQGAFEKAGIVDAAIGLCATDDEYKQNRIRYFVFLNRHGEAYKHYEGVVDPERMKMTVKNQIEYNPDDEEEKPKRRMGTMKRAMAKGSALTQED